MIKGFVFYYKLLIFSVNTAWVIPLKYKKRITITNAFQRNSDESKQNAKRTKYEYINAANFTIDQWNHGCRIIIMKSIQHITKVNLLLLKDLPNRFTKLNKIYIYLTSVSKNVYIDKN